MSDLEYVHVPRQGEEVIATVAGPGAYLERKRNEGSSRREALRCLKRLLAPVVFNTFKTNPLDMGATLAHVKICRLLLHGQSIGLLRVSDRRGSIPGP